MEEMKLIFSAYSKHNFYFREHISKYILETGNIPLNPFMSFEYFMLDTVPRDIVRSANNTLVKRADELWIFGQIADGVFNEIQLAKENKKPIKYFKIKDSKIIERISKENVEFEKGLEKYKERL
jgi:hypothetical protein